MRGRPFFSGSAGGLRVGMTLKERRGGRGRCFEFIKGFRETFSRPVRRMRFLGLFNAVNSVPRCETAWVERSKFPYTARSSARVARQAVIIDERRAKFRQDLMYQSDTSRMEHRQHHFGHHLVGTGHTIYHTNEKSRGRSGLETTACKSAVDKEGRGRRPSQIGQLGSAQPDELGAPTPTPYRAHSRSESRETHGTAESHISQNGLSIDYRDEKGDESEDETQRNIDEVWFAGNHADIGGGWEGEPNSKNSSHVPLVWMVREEMRAGLRFDMAKVVAMGCSEVLGGARDNRP